MLFEKQKNWSNSANPSAIFVQYAEELGLDVQKFRQHMNAPLLSDKIDENKKEGLELGITGTPTFFLNGEKMELTSFADFYEQIARAVNPDVKFDLPATATSTNP
jgi:protein-disulfide isomerase